MLDRSVTEIEKNSIPHTPPAGKTLTYDGSAQTLVEPGQVDPDKGTMLYSLDKTDWSETPPEGTKAETYSVYWKITASGGYSDVGPETVTSEIQKANPVYTPPSGQELAYTGRDQVLSLAGSVQGGTLYYSLDQINWLTSLPTGLEAGTYQVYWKIVGDENHSDVTGSFVESRITSHPDPGPGPDPEPKPEPKPEPQPADSDSAPRYPVEIPDKTPLGGTVKTNLNSAAERDTVYINAVPSPGYRLREISAVDKDGNALDLTDLGKTRYSFKMPPRKVTVSASFVRSEPGRNGGFALCSRDGACPIARFSDAAPSAWYHDGLHFCLDSGLLSGDGSGALRPNGAVSRAAFLSVLWRMSGKPVVNGILPFADVPEDLWCAEAVRWALSEGLTGGYSDSVFRPNAPLTREQMAVILHRYAARRDLPEAGGADLSGFADADAASETAVPALAWAWGTGLLQGWTAAGGGRILNPQGICTRAQAAAVIARFAEALAA